MVSLIRPRSGKSVRNMKQRVQYIGTADIIIGDSGLRAFLIPMDHPSRLVINGERCLTGTVLKYDPHSGELETKRTVYYKVPLPPLCTEREATLAAHA